MGVPVTKTVKLNWDGANWRDAETSVLVTGVLPPYPVDSQKYSGEWVQASEPVQFAEGGQPFKHESFSADQRVTIQEMIEKTIVRRSVPKQFMYFVEGDWLITYAYHRDTVQALSHEINQLERRIARLERPWWKRW